VLYLRGMSENEAEKVQRQSEEWLRLAVQAGKMYAYEWDVTTDVLVRSPEYVHVLAATEPRTLTHQQVLEQIHPDDRPKLLAAIARHSPENPTVEVTYRVLLPGKPPVWVKSSGRAFFDGEGRMLRVIGMVADVTDQKLAEEALRLSEERLRLAQQAARIGTFERDVRTGRITWAEGLEPLYGLSAGSLDGKTPEFVKDLIHPTDRQRVAQLIQQALKTGHPTEGEWRAIWPDDSVHWIVSRWQVLMDESGEPSRVVGVNMDVTERKLAELALHAREELLEIFVKNVPAPVAMLDRDMRYVQVSDRWCGDYLAGRAQVLGRSHYELFPDMPERWKEVHRRALAGETLRADEDHWVGQDGPHWARWEVRPWMTLEGSIGGILILAEDISRRKQMEEALSGMSRKLIEAQEQERTWIAREMHDDINQRLSLAAMELDRQGQNLQASADELRWSMAEVYKQISELSSDIHLMSHRLHSLKLDSLGLAAAAKSFCCEIAKRQDVEVEFSSARVPRKLPEAISLCLFRVLQEALQNAVTHSGVRCFRVSLVGSTSQVALTVSDGGCGFRTEEVLRKGGLGLTSMKERLNLVGGKFEIDAKPSRGTIIRAFVPLKPQAKFAGAGI
jgi:PAS domain S-box-containing protein